MSILQQVKKYKNSPVAIIFKGATILGVELSKLLIEQGAFVICIDEYSKKKKERVESLLAHERFGFIDISGTNSIADSIERVDYIFYFNLDNESYDAEVSTTRFLERSNTLDRLLQLGANKDSKFLLASSIEVHRVLQARKEISSTFYDEDESMSYTVIEVQRYAENLTWEYHKRGGLDVRVVRIGEILGEGIDIEQDSLVLRNIKNAIKGNNIVIEGDGLENLYFVHVLDAAYGLLKAQFSQNTNGKVFSLFIPRDITVLNLAYKILDFEPKAAGIDFVDKVLSEELNIYKPAPNIGDIGWKPKISFERALAQTINYLYSIYGRKKTYGKKPLEKSTQKKRKKNRSIKDFLINFFFEVKEEKEKKSVLDSMQYSSYDKKALRDLERPDHIRSQQRKSKHSTSDDKKSMVKIPSFIRSPIRKVTSQTISSLIVYCVVILIGLLFYLLFLVPCIRTIFFIGKSYYYSNEVKESIEQENYSKSITDLSQMNSSLENVRAGLDKLSYMTHIAYFEPLNDFQQKIQNSQGMINSSYEIYKQYKPLGNYLHNYSSNIELVGSEDISLSLEDHESLELVYDRRSIQQIMAMLNQDTLITAETTIGVPFIDKWLSSFGENLEYIQREAVKSESTLSILYPLLAPDGKHTYAILFENEIVSIKPQGGNIAAIALFTIDNGYISKIGVYSPSDFVISVDEEQERIVRNDIAFLYPDDGMTFENLSLLYSEDLFSSLMKRSLGNEFGEEVDSIILINIEAMQDIIVLFDGIKLHGNRSVNATNLSDNLNNGTVSHEEILAHVLVKLFETFPSSLSEISSVFHDHMFIKDIRFLTEDLSLLNMLESSQVPTIPSTDKYDALDIRFLSEGAYLPDIKLEYNVTVKKKHSEVEYMLSFEGSSENGSEAIAIVGLGPNFTIKDVVIESEGLTLASSYSNRVFLRIDLESEEKAKMSIIGSGKNVVIKEKNDYNYRILLKKPYGLVYQYEINVIHTDFSVHTYPEGSTVSKKKTMSRGEIDGDTLIEYDFTPRSSD